MSPWNLELIHSWDQYLSLTCVNLSGLTLHFVNFNGQETLNNLFCFIKLTQAKYADVFFGKVACGLNVAFSRYQIPLTIKQTTPSMPD